MASTESDWTAVEEALSAYQSRLALTDTETSILREGCSRPEQLALVLRLLSTPSRLAPDGRGAFRQLLQRADESDFDIRDWIAALEIFYRWLEEHNRKASLDEALGYLSCCAEAADQQPDSGSLASCTTDMLNQWGFAGPNPV